MQQVEGAQEFAQTEEAGAFGTAAPALVALRWRVAEARDQSVPPSVMQPQEAPPCRWPRAQAQGAARSECLFACGSRRHGPTFLNSDASSPPATPCREDNHVQSTIPQDHKCHLQRQQQPARKPHTCLKGVPILTDFQRRRCAPLPRLQQMQRHAPTKTLLSNAPHQQLLNKHMALDFATHIMSCHQTHIARRVSVAPTSS